MQKKQRKAIEQQLTITIAYFLKKHHLVAAQGMAKLIKSATKEIAKKFVKEISKFEKAQPSAKKGIKSQVKTPAQKTSFAKKIKSRRSAPKAPK